MRATGWALLGVAAGAAIVAAWRARGAPAELDARTTCSTLLRAACDRQRDCGGTCSTRNPVACGAVVAAELDACMGRAAPGETFSSEAVGECQRAFLGQPCPAACDQFIDPPACTAFRTLSAD